MRKRQLFKTVLSSVVGTSMAVTMLAVAVCGSGCKTKKKPGEGSDPGNEPGSGGGENKPPVVQTTKLEAPAVVLNENVITWNPVQYATGYEVFEGETSVSSQTSADTSYYIDKMTAGTYTYTVKATTTDTNYSTSDASNSVSYTCGTSYAVQFLLDEDTQIFDRQIVAEGEKAKAIATDPAKPGYEFDKWVTSRGGSTEYDFNAPVNANVKVYAAWTAKSYSSYDVTFIVNGGSAVETQTITAGSTATKPTDPTKENFNFAGWFKDEDCTEEFDFDTAINGATNLYAKWTLQPSVTAIESDTTYSFNSNDANAEDGYYVLKATENVEGSSTDFNGIKLDATTGKIWDNNGQWFQFNTGAVISFYVKAGANVKIETYQNALTYKVNGEDAVAGTYEFKSDEYVTITSDASMYIGYIRVTYPGDPTAIPDNTTITFGSAGNFTTTAGVSTSGQISSSNTDNSQIKTGATVSFYVNANAKVEVTAYSDPTYVGYTIGLKGQVPSDTQTGNYTFKPAKAGTVVITGAIDNNYLVSVKVTYEEPAGPAIPDGYERVTSTADLSAGLAKAGEATKLGADTTIGRFTFGEGSYFNASTGGLSGNVWNNQQKKLSFEITGADNNSVLKFDAKGAGSGVLKLYKSDNTVVKDFGTIGGTAQLNLTAENLAPGSYYLQSVGSCRLGNISITETVKMGKPVSMTVKASTVDFMVGQTFTSAGLSANVNYGGSVVKVKTNVTVDSSSVDMSKAGEYIVRVFYTELGETVTAMYTVNVCKVVLLQTSEFKTNGAKQETLQKVYKTGATLSQKGLAMRALCKNASVSREFLLGAADYTVSSVDMTTAGEKEVVITLKANDKIKTSYKINVVEAAVAEANAITLTVNPANAVSSTNFHKINDALTYLASLELGADVVKTINVADGAYYEKVSVNIPNVRLIGSSAVKANGTTDNGVVIWYDALAGQKDGAGTTFGTNGSATVTVTSSATKFVAKNITFKNYYNTNALYNESKTMTSDTQAVALLVESASASFYDCKMSGYHDTLYSNKGNHYYYNCWIEGRTDYIFGQDAHAYFDGCTIYTADAGSADGDGGYVCALKPSNASAGWYFVFNGCKFEGPETGATDIALGRAWGPDMKMVIINSEISGNYSTTAHTNTTTKKQRYCTMSGNEPKPANMIEANNTGDGAISESLANTCTVDATAATTYGTANLATILGFTPESN